MSGRPDDAVPTCIVDIAADTGRLRRGLAPDGSAWFTGERLAGRILSLDAMTSPSAAELAVEFFQVAGDWQLAVEEALRVVDERSRLLRGLLHPEPRR